MITKTRSFFRSSKLQHNRHIKGKPDTIIATVVAIIIVFGVIALSSASSVISFQQYGNAYNIVFRQLIVGLLPGLILFYIFYRTDYHIWQKRKNIFLIASIILLASVFIPGLGRVYHGAQSWINILGITFQPAEFVKLTFIIFLAGWFAERGVVVVREFWQGFVFFLLITGVILGLILLQPDIGTLMVFAVITTTMYFLAGGKIQHLMWIFLGGIASIAILASRITYIKNRILVFFNPQLDPQNIGYHINQAFLAIGSGGWFGRGYGKSQQKFAYLPEVTGDSIFAIIAEEFGFIVVSVLIIMFLVLAYRGLKIAKNAPDPFGRFLSGGIVIWFVFQAFFNIAVMTGLAPLTGIPLPFISRGGTAMVSGLAAMGLLLNISRQKY